jgi:hypothetical protein
MSDFCSHSPHLDTGQIVEKRNDLWNTAQKPIDLLLPCLNFQENSKRGTSHNFLDGFEGGIVNITSDADCTT